MAAPRGPYKLLIKPAFRPSDALSGRPYIMSMFQNRVAVPLGLSIPFTLSIQNQSPDTFPGGVVTRVEVRSGSLTVDLAANVSVPSIGPDLEVGVDQSFPLLPLS